MDVELSIVMPCLNEAETLATCIRKANSYLAASSINGEVLIGDNGSTDGCQDIARSLGARVIEVPLRGYGAALFGAISAAKGKYCIMGDSDDSYDFEHLDGFVDKLRAGHDLVMGNRFAGGIKEGAMPWKNRYIGNPVLSAIGKTLFSAPAEDFHCGLRGFSKQAFHKLDLRTTGMEFASEMVIKATLLGLRVTEVPTTLSPDGRSRPPHLRPYRDGWRHLRFMLLFSPDWLFLYPGLFLIFTGLVGGTILMNEPVFLRNVRFGIDTLIYCGSLFGVGTQAVLFSALSRAFAVQEGLYPENPKLRSYVSKITLELGLLVGLAILLAGIASACYAVLEWRHNAFGPMVTEHIARLVIPSSVALSLGCEIVLFSFLLSTFSLSAQPYRTLQLSTERPAEAEISSAAFQ